MKGGRAEGANTVSWPSRFLTPPGALQEQAQPKYENSGAIPDRDCSGIACPLMPALDFIAHFYQFKYYGELHLLFFLSFFIVFYTRNLIAL